MEDMYNQANEPQEESVPTEGHASEKPKTMAYSVASLILAMMSLACCCVGWASILFGILSIVFAIVSRRHLGYFDSMAVVGLIIGIVGTVCGGFMLTFNLLNVAEGFEGIDPVGDLGLSI